MFRADNHKHRRRARFAGLSLLTANILAASIVYTLCARQRALSYKEALAMFRDAVKGKLAETTGAPVGNQNAKKDKGENNSAEAPLNIKRGSNSNEYWQAVFVTCRK